MPDLDGESVAAMHSLRASALTPASTIDDVTWAELDLDEVRALFPTVSSLGELVLYGWLRCPALSASEFGVCQRRRIACSPAASQALARLPRLPALLVSALWGKETLRSLGAWPKLLAALAVVGPLAFLVSMKAGLVTIAAIFVLNLFLHFWWDPKVAATVGSLDFLAAALEAARALRDDVGLDAATRGRLRALTTTLRPLHRAASEARLPAYLSDLSVYPSILFMTAERRLSVSAALVATHRAALREMLELLGSLDASQATAAFVANRTWCTPSLGGRAELVVEALQHPLLPHGVPNSLELRGVGIVTGSNMSGKSTFLRAVAINTLLAQSLGVSCSRAHAAPFLRLATSLRVVDRLSDGRSTYLAEAERIAQLLRETKTPGLFIIDEPFRGTNSPERIAAGIALFKHLQRERHLALGATHDLELARETTEAQLWHFADGVTASGLSFDYSLRTGLTTEHNALRLLRLLGYPVTLVDEAARWLARADGDSERRSASPTPEPLIAG